MSRLNAASIERYQGAGNDLRHMEQEAVPEYASDSSWTRLEWPEKEDSEATSCKRSIQRKNKTRARRQRVANIVAFLNSAHENLIFRQDRLMNIHAEFTRQRDLHKDYYSLVEQSLGRCSGLLMSCSDRITNEHTNLELSKLHQDFLSDKTRLLNQLIDVDSSADRLREQQYCVIKQQAWFVSLVRRLADGSAPSGEIDSFFANSALVDGSLELGPEAGDLPSDPWQSPNSIWAATMWDIIDKRLDAECQGAETSSNA